MRALTVHPGTPNSAGHTNSIGEVDLASDIIVECSGVPSVVVDVLYQSGHDGVVCLDIFADALDGRKDDVKVVLEIGS
jgi:hypothetical protein